MFNTLRSRLLLSYIGVIAIALWVVAMSLLFFATRPGVRYLSTMQHLAAVGTSNRQELFRLLETGADTPAYERLLNETAVSNNVRVLIADISSNKILYDSDPNQSWLGGFSGVAVFGLPQVVCDLLEDCLDLGTGFGVEIAAYADHSCAELTKGEVAVLVLPFESISAVVGVLSCDPVRDDVPESVWTDPLGVLDEVALPGPECLGVGLLCPSELFEVVG